MNTKIVYENLLKGIKSSITEDILRAKSPKRREYLSQIKLTYIRLLDVLEGHVPAVRK